MSVMLERSPEAIKRLHLAASAGLEAVAQALADPKGMIEFGEATTAAVGAAIGAFKTWTKDQAGTLEDFLELAREVWAELERPPT